MTQIQIQTELSTKAAFAHGVTDFGYLLVTPTEEQIQGLSAEERVAIAQYVAPSAAADKWRHPAVLAVAGPGWDGVIDGLRTARAQAENKRREREAEIEKERGSYRRFIALLHAGNYYEPGSMPPDRSEASKAVGWDMSPNYGKGDPETERLWGEFGALRKTVREALILGADDELMGDGERHIREDFAVSPEVSRLLDTKVWRNGKNVYDPEPTRALAIAAEAERRSKLEEQRKKDENRSAVRAVIEESGTPDQIERFDAGVLPRDERRELVLKKLFASLADQARYEEITEQEVAHECECEPDETKFSSSDYEGALTAEAWRVLKEIRAKLPSGAVATPREHVGYQAVRTGASDPEIRRLSVRVTIPFAGEKWVQEYALP